MKAELKISLKDLIDSLLFVYSVLVFLGLAFGLGIPIEATMVFVMFVPGYGVLENFSPDIPLVEKFAASCGFSLALFLGLRSLMEASQMLAFSEMAATSAVALVSLAVVVIRKAR